ncbi:hypothetical protein SAY86_009369 [Trapa natans]|uniref:Uncharacterized protein n=1 Tax=Trapa natans TaxID=22666 RepID=A0AAN7KZL7_TRANT|nr:hypothetical protein SAY86_009369 [Trapa natans]
MLGRTNTMEELEEITSELLALRKLYRLLQTIEDGQSNGIELQLDLRARMLLKRLLDLASEGLLKTYSEIITGQLSTRMESSAPSSSQIADSVFSNCRSESGFEIAIPKKEVPWLPEISSDKQGISNRQYDNCIQNNTMKQTSSNDTKWRLLVDLWNGKCLGAFPLVMDYKTDHNPLVQKMIQPSNGEISQPRDIHYAIKRIETQVMVLQRLSQLVNPLKGAVRQMEEYEMKIPAQISNQIPRNLTNLWTPPQEVSKYTPRMVEGTEDSSWSMTQAQASNAWTSRQINKYMDGLHIPEIMTETEMTPVRRVIEPARKVKQSIHHSDEILESTTPTSSSNRTLMKRKNLTNHQRVHTLAPMQRSVDKKLPPRSNRTRKSVLPMLMNRKLGHRMEPEEQSSQDSKESSSCSSSWTCSQEDTRSSSSSSDDYSRSSYTDNTDFSQGTNYMDFSQGSRSESEDASSSSSSDSVPSLHEHVEPAPKAGPRRGSPSPNQGKAIGRLKKIKNKLGLIFHHHHHHHHHHHENEGNRSEHKSNWKRVGNSMLCSPKGHLVSGGKEVVDTSKQSVVKRSQGSHIHALVEGFLRQFHQKKKKSRLPNPKVLARNNKTKNEKLQWLKMMKQHGGVRLNGRRQAKLKLSDKRKQLGATKS